MTTIALIDINEALVAFRDDMLAHWQEVGFPGAFDPDHDAYRKLGQLGMTFMLVARDDAGNMIGYSSTAVVPRLHQRTEPMAVCDALYVVPAYRKGRTASMLIRATEQEAAQRGAVRMMWTCPTGSAFASAMKRRGYIPVEEIVMRAL